SSINVGSIKNVLGTFTPPARVTIATRLLDTLSPEDVRSGVGEMLKVHAIEGPEAFDAIAADYTRLFDDRETMERYVHRSLEIKKRVIEIDEFDRGPRNVMNYGHSFGHALESATGFAVPHGIAVTIGMDMANYTARQLGLADGAFERMHGTLAANYSGFEDTPVPLDAFLEAIGKDKKNVGSELRLVLPDGHGRVGIGTYPADDRFRSIVSEYLEGVRRA
ncbi:MAG: 3-dehydroquinate synthase, partial [Thermoleophilaceae bacterium]